MQGPDATPYPLDHLACRGAHDSIALVTKTESIGFSTLDAMTGRLANALRTSGLRPGDRVATWLNKTVDACIMPLAAARAGLVHVPINAVLKRAQVAHILADSGAKALITGAGRADSLVKNDLPMGCTLWLEERATAARETGAMLPPSNCDPNDLAAILYTSGSTGKPKGVMLSHANLWLGAVSVAHYLKITPEDRVLALLPLSFDYGQNQLLSTWAAGATAVPLDFMTPREVVKAVERHKITSLAGVPPLWVQLVEADWSADSTASLKRLTNSGGALTPTLVQQLRSRFNDADLYPMYGLTEAFRSTYLDPALVARHPTSIGSAIPFAEIMVVGRDGAEAAAGEPGELVHAGPLVAQGYWQDADRTSFRFKPAPQWSRFGGMAVWSGDTVRRDEDGLLYFVGRDDEMIKTSGNRISPGEIEEVAVASGIAVEAVALGIADDRLGQSIALIVRARGGVDDPSEALRQHFKRELPNFMQPKFVQVWNDLPRNANGKLDRAGIREQFLKMDIAA